MKKIFITGTDTDCGKTYVTCQMVLGLQRMGKRVGAIKPIASGCLVEGEAVINADEQALQRANALPIPVTGWRLQEAIAPHLAAKHQNIVLAAHRIYGFSQQPAYDHLEYLLIEGAGGLMVPLNDHETWLDFLKISQVPVILVVGIRLGCINHALLSIFAAEQENITCLGWIANCIEPQMPSLRENIDTIMHRVSIPLLGIVGHGGIIEDHCLERIVSTAEFTL